MTFLRFILRKYFLPRGVNLMSFAVFLSVLGVAVGVLQLMVVLAVMTGFQDLFRENYTRISSELVVIPRNLNRGEKQIEDRLKAIPQLAAVTPSLLAPAMVIRGPKVGGVIFEGVDFASSQAVTPWDNIWVQKPEEGSSPPGGQWVWLGVQLAKKLKVSVGDTVDVLIPEGSAQKVLTMPVTGITKFGIYDHDLHHARMSIETVRKMFHKDNQEPIYKCKIRAGEDFDKVSGIVKSAMGEDANVRLWKDVHQNIFMAVEHQKKSLFLVLEILVGLAAVNVVNLLLMSAHFRKRDLAILRAMGMKASQVVTFFLAQGVFVGCVGVALGVVMGFAACALISRYQPSLLNESIYNSVKLPMHIAAGDLALLCAGGILICLVFSLIPAWGAARTRPVEALRLENS